MNSKLALGLLAAVLGPPALSVCAALPKAAPPMDMRAKVSVPSRTSASASERTPPSSKLIVRLPDESLAPLARRILPPGARTLTGPLEMQFPPLGKVIVILFQNPSDAPSETNDPSLCRGWLLIPDGNPQSYRIEALPSITDGLPTLSYDIRSVFTADADGDGTVEFCVLSEVEVTGGREKPYFDTDIFKWTGTAFALVEMDEQHSLYGLRNAKAVRARLKKSLAHPSDRKVLDAHQSSFFGDGRRKR